MKVAFFNSHTFEQEAFESSNNLFKHDIHFFEPRLNQQSAKLAEGFECVCAFVNDSLDEEVLRTLKMSGTKIIALRSAGFNHVDLKAAKALGLTVIRVPDYSPYAVAEHVVALILTLNRKTHRAYNRVREGNFSLNGMVGFDLHGKTVGIIGTGKIGKVLARIMHGFGCNVFLYDMEPDFEFAKEVGATYSELSQIFKSSDIISLHIPLTDKTLHFINHGAIEKMKKGVMIINTGRGGLIDTKALIKGLKTGQVGNAGLDVYEEEAGIFFEDLTGKILTDDVLARLMTFPNVLITSHQAFLTNEALTNIAQTTLQGISDFEHHIPLIHAL